MRAPVVYVLIAFAGSTLFAACSDDKKRAATGSGSATPAASAHGGKVIELGDSTIGAWSVRATRDEGQIVAGKDAPIDVTVKPAAGSTAKPMAVRFWIGLEDAKVSVKAKAGVENPAEPDRWHTHAEIPDPIPAGSRLWVEIEGASGEKSVGSFDLKA